MIFKTEDKIMRITIEKHENYEGGPFWVCLGDEVLKTFKTLKSAEKYAQKMAQICGAQF